MYMALSAHYLPILESFSNKALPSKVFGIIHLRHLTAKF